MVTEVRKPITIAADHRSCELAAYALIVGAVFLAHATRCGAVEMVAGDLITLTDAAAAPNGAWSWFEDERAIIDDSDPENPLLLVSSVSSWSTAGERGDIDLLWLNTRTGAKGHFELHDQLETPDDHNSASLMRRPDGRYLAVYARHNNADVAWYRVSTNPGDPTSWTPSQTIQMEFDSGNGVGVTYANAYHLPNEGGPNGRTYNFSRAENFDPTLAYSDDQGTTWNSEGYKLVTRPGADIANRPYARYFGDDNRIHVTVTETHPRNNLNNSVYHGYVQDGKLYDSFGVLKDANLFDGAAVDPDELTPVFLGGTVVSNTTMRRAWTTDVAINGQGNPVTVFTTRANDNSEDHRLFYAEFDGAAWNVDEIAKMGGSLYAPDQIPAEEDYTGLASIDPNDTSTVFVSTDIDPRTNQGLDRYEIFRGVRESVTGIWSWDPITFNSLSDNLRPLVPEWNIERTALVWMRGDYTNFQKWNTQVVALTEITALTDIPSPADLDGQDGVSTADYLIFLQNLLTDVSTLSPEESLLKGDFDGDLDIDYDDLIRFRQEYDLFNGQGALADLSAATPEPAAFGVLTVGLGVYSLLFRGSR